MALVGVGFVGTSAGDAGRIKFLFHTDFAQIFPQISHGFFCVKSAEKSVWNLRETKKISILSDYIRLHKRCPLRVIRRKMQPPTLLAQAR